MNVGVILRHVISVWGRISTVLARSVSTTGLARIWALILLKLLVKLVHLRLVILTITSILLMRLMWHMLLLLEQTWRISNIHCCFICSRASASCTSCASPNTELILDARKLLLHWLFFLFTTTAEECDRLWVMWLLIMYMSTTWALWVDILSRTTSSMMVITYISTSTYKAMVLMHIVLVLLPVLRHLWLRIVCLSCRLSLLHLLLLGRCQITLTKFTSTTTWLLGLVLAWIHNLHLLLSLLN